ncbi:MFS transporter [Bengtsoniella intestinalis]|uniref:MFS transporter n=1 Tax=Bengtsoniella intestinalis TaxID=3073143 RepID=UPI00391F3795
MLTPLLAIIYLAFISLGLPDAVLGAAWPTISTAFDTSVSSMGMVTIIIAAGTIVSSLQSHRLIHKIGVHAITTISVGITAVSLLGFAYSPNFWVLCLWAVPYGLGAGSVDAALNNYVSLHFESKHMSWLHCMWGVGATTGPYLMGMALTGGAGFSGGYVALFAIQGVLTAVIFLSRPVWTASAPSSVAQQHSKVLSLKEIFAIQGVAQIALTFFCFCAIEQTTGLWASSYLVYQRGVAPETAAGVAALFYLGITVGRGINGFIAMKATHSQMIYGGCVIMAIGVVVLLLPMGQTTAFAGLLLIGLGSSPVYPSIIHATPHTFGIAHAQAITGVEMASAYTGTLTMPALFGLLGNGIGFWVYPVYIGVLLAVMVVLYGWTMRKTKN